MHDVIVIGAGPVGAYTAFQLTDRGYDVVLLEKKPSAGQHIVCSGVIGKTAFQRYELPRAAILTKIDAFTIFSPQGQRLEYIHPDTLAYVVDRAVLDRYLVARAQKRGARVLFNQPVTQIEQTADQCQVHAAGNSYRGRFVILATGVNYRLHGLAGLSRPPDFLLGAQLDLNFKPSSAAVQIHLGREIAPGSFGWVIPLTEDRSRVGLLVQKNARAYLKKMLATRVYPQMERKPRKNRILVKPIAYGPVERSVHHRIAAVGEAAGQIKTTTGGGIAFGLLCSEILCDKLHQAFKNGDHLQDYNLEWHSVLMSEINIGYKTRQMAEKLDDLRLENLFNFVKKNRFWVNTLMPRVHFDHHTDLLYYCLETFRFLLKK